nr:hypothetical protein HK105_006784 [Polyrhizophydium stewartii]
MATGREQSEPDRIEQLLDQLAFEATGASRPTHSPDFSARLPQTLDGGAWALGLSAFSIAHDPGRYRFPCTLCDRKFTRRYNLEAHLHAHQNMRPFQCTHAGCGEAFVRKYDLTRHVDAVHSGRRFGPCPVCGMYYTRADALRKHVQRCGIVDANDLVIDSDSESDDDGRRGGPAMPTTADRDDPGDAGGDLPNMAHDCGAGDGLRPGSRQQQRSDHRRHGLSAPSARKPSQPATLVPPTVVRPVLVAAVDPNPAAAAVFSPFPWHRSQPLTNQADASRTVDGVADNSGRGADNSDSDGAEAAPPGIDVFHRTTLQYSVHTPGRHLAREIALVFPGLVKRRAGEMETLKGELKDLLVVPTFQESVYDLVGITPATNWERDVLLEYFLAFGKLFCGWLHERGFWADMTDPASGFPVYSDRGTSLYPDVDGCARLLRYATHLAGCCRVLDHPVWGTHSYPATMFAAAPVELVRQALEYATAHGRNHVMALGVRVDGEMAVETSRVMSIVHSFKLNTGAVIPAFGLGTWRSKPNEVRDAVAHAIKVGYTHIDAAWVYENEDEVGAGIKASGVPREKLFITSKLWNTFHRPEQVPLGLKDTLTKLDTPYLDLYLMHWPLAHVNDGTGNSVKDETTGKSKIDPVPVIDTWRAMEKLVDEGKVKAIGVSNFNITKLKALLEVARIRPAVNQVELHPYLPQDELVDFCRKEGILVTAYSPLGSTPGPGTVLNDPVVLEIAERNGKTPAQVLISWAIQRGTQAIPKSVNPTRIEQNLQYFALSDADFKALSDLNKSRPAPTRYVDPSGWWGVDIYSE